MKIKRPPLECVLEFRFLKEKKASSRGSFWIQSFVEEKKTSPRGCFWASPSGCFWKQSVLGRGGDFEKNINQFLFYKIVPDWLNMKI